MILQGKRKEKLCPSGQPNHVAFIMDGNGRWAESIGLPRSLGHIVGAKVLLSSVDYLLRLNVRYITCYAMSYDNTKRSQHEVELIFNVLGSYISSVTMINYCVKRGIRVKFIGMIEVLPDKYRKLIEGIEVKTQECCNMYMNIALLYSSQAEILHAVQSLLKKHANNQIDTTKIDIRDIYNETYAPDFPDPDIILRTGAEKRLSDFMLFQASYSELVFMDCMWPEFSSRDIDKMMLEYKSRDRRFGGHNSVRD